LRTRWQALCRRIGARPEPAAGIFDRLERAYGEPHRAYHTLEHIDYCLRQLKRIRSMAEHPDECEMALWFHDAVYDTRAHDNEEKSAEWAVRAAHEMGLSTEFALRVRDLVLATKHMESPQGADAQVVVDCDLASLALPAKEFARNSRNIRREYDWVPEKQYIERRDEILGRFLKRPSIYSTPLFRKKLEPQARKNLSTRTDSSRA
jgi:predicted metal-dependent HD superfamily phosphohydrolase